MFYQRALYSAAMQVIFLVLIALALVSIGAEILVRHSSLLALRAGISSLVVGLTIVGFGTSSPELGASITATLAGFDGVSVGNVIGSNIFNVAVILALTALICPIAVELPAVRSDIVVAILAAIVPFISLFFAGTIPGIAGFALLLILVLYLFRAYRRGTSASKVDKALIATELEEMFPIHASNEVGTRPSYVHLGYILFSLVLLIGGSKLFVENAVALARGFGVSELVIGLTIVSVGTSLPELITSVVAALKRNTEIAVGNILGSNIFNSFCILGSCAVLKPQAVSAQSIWLDTPVMVITTVALLPIIKTGGVISRREGGLLLTGYGLYLAVLVTLAR